MFTHVAARTVRWPPTGPFLEVLQTILRLLIGPEYFRLEREFAGPGFRRGEQRWLAKFEHWDKWNFCLNSAMMPANRRDYDEAYPP
jgi:hypothetical protein